MAQAPRFYRSHGQAVADLREAVMPPSVSSRLGVQPDSIMFTEPWGEEVYQLGVRRLGTFDPHRREGVVALRIQPVAFEPPLPLRPRAAATTAAARQPPPPSQPAVPPPPHRERRSLRHTSQAVASGWADAVRGAASRAISRSRSRSPARSDRYDAGSWCQLGASWEHIKTRGIPMCSTFLAKVVY